MKLTLYAAIIVLVGIVIGVDCFRPVSINIGRLTDKRWGVSFKCMTTRAVHLDLLDNMSTDAFLMALQHFVAQCGNAHKLLSNCGSNFKGAERELRENGTIMEPSLTNQLAGCKVSSSLCSTGSGRGKSAAALNQDNADCSADRKFLLDLKSLLKLHLGERIKPPDSPQLRNSSAGGATFSRWGRTTCPQGNDVVYKGYAGGSHYQAKGGPGTTLCLPEAPIYETHTSVVSYSYIYGTEYQTDAANAPLHRLLHDDVPCVVCQSQHRTSAIMVPARNECFPGWHLEYKGYLFGGATTHTGSSDYVCIDSEAEAMPGGEANTDGHLLYLIDAKCGALPCPPYVDGWELTCALCTK